MRILICPMAALGKMSGPINRTKALAEAFTKKGNQVALCAAKDGNFDGTTDYPLYDLETPVPLGLPKMVGKRLLPVVAKTGVQSHKTISSFEEVQFISGNIQPGYFKRAVHQIQAAIQDFRPDVVYSEFNLAAIAAAKLAGTVVFGSYSRPTQVDFAASPGLGYGVKRVLKSLGLPQVDSSLDILDWVDRRIVPSSPRLEPIIGDNVCFTGPFTAHQTHYEDGLRSAIVAYMGSGTLSGKRLVNALYPVFSELDFEVFIVAPGVKESHRGFIHIGEYFDFSEIYPRCCLSINHGGQNSIMDALYHGIPQILCPGKVFERRYNAQSIAKNKAGLVLDTHCFEPPYIRGIMRTLLENKGYAKNAQILGKELTALGGADRVVQLAVEYFGG
ncbi:MAG: glycosyltransferase [Eubacterium aggregans]|uniref:glycosyltransferase n=1 Tax=Eubacterium aggregans TaxID=81409 RepID=UPI0023F404EC|nr:nucleotide disphospho-sugar-binding domain-containing protein [Eubacterium aggregans]MDD4690787.1 glycosyltransferase [Eubacterium aggregans]MEA5072717.1 glycosyltransferase [Eubacterium aggregans]